MRVSVLVGSVFVVGLALLAISCNAIVGEEVIDVKCHVASQLGPIVSYSTTTMLSRVQQGVDPGSELTFELSNSSKLYVYMLDRVGRSRILTTDEDHWLTEGDGGDQSCGICISAEIYVNRGPDPIAQHFQALPQGHLHLDIADATRLVGSLQGLALRHVTMRDGVTTDVNDGCMTAIDNIEFDMFYPPSL